MSAESNALAYSGYWREPNISGVPAQWGVYSVYVCRYNADNTVTLLKLVYIGESANVNDRLRNHERYRDWRRHVGLGQELCFNFAPVSIERERIEAALVHQHKPLENTSNVDSFPYPQTTVSTSGCNAMLSTYFTVYSTVHSALSAYLSRGVMR